MLEVSGVGIGYSGVLDEAIEVDVGGDYVVEGCLVFEDIYFEVGFGDIGHVGCYVWGNQVKLSLNK